MARARHGCAERGKVPRIRVFANAHRQVPVVKAGLRFATRMIGETPVDFWPMKSNALFAIPRRRPLSFLTIWLLALAILTAQALGFMHGVTHPPASHAGAMIRPATMAMGQPVGSAVKGKLELLFSSHSSDAQCRLFDHAALSGAALQVVPMALPVLLPLFLVPIFQGEALARWAALFDARGPPSTR